MQPTFPRMQEKVQVFVQPLVLPNSLNHYLKCFNACLILMSPIINAPRTRSRPEVLYKKGVLKNFGKFTGK